MGGEGEGGLSAVSGQSTLSVFMISGQFNGGCNSGEGGGGWGVRNLRIYQGEVRVC